MAFRTRTQAVLWIVVAMILGGGTLLSGRPLAGGTAWILSFLP